MIGKPGMSGAVTWGCSIGETQEWRKAITASSSSMRAQPTALAEQAGELEHQLAEGLDMVAHHVGLGALGRVAGEPGGHRRARLWPGVKVMATKLRVRSCRPAASSRSRRSASISSATGWVPVERG